MRTNNKILTEKVAELEKEVHGLREEHVTISETAKLQPSCEVRVNRIIIILIALITTFFFFFFLQNVIRKVYRSLVESSENFGWNLK